MREKYQYLTLEEKEEVCDYLRAGKTHEWIAYKLCCSPITIGGIFRELTGSHKELIQESLTLFQQIARLPFSQYKFYPKIRGLIPRLQEYLNLKKKRSRNVQDNEE